MATTKIFAPDGSEWEIDNDKLRAEIGAGYYQGWSLPTGQVIPVRGKQEDVAPAGRPSPEQASAPEGPWQRLARKTRLPDNLEFKPLVKFEGGQEQFKIPGSAAEESGYLASGYKPFEPTGMDVTSTIGGNEALLGGMDELKGAVGAVPVTLFDNPQGKSVVENYTDIRDRERQRQEAVRAARPTLSAVEGFAAGALVPGGLARTAAAKALPAAAPILRLGARGAPSVSRGVATMGAEGAAYGGLSALGHAQGTPMEQAVQAGVGAVAGAGTGAALGGVFNKFMSRPGTYKAPDYDVLSPTSWLDPTSLAEKAALDRAASLRASGTAQNTLAETVAPGEPLKDGLIKWGTAINQMDAPLSQKPSGMLARWNQRRQPPVLGRDADAVGLDTTLTTVADKFKRDILRTEAPLADVPVPFDPLKAAIQRGPIASMTKNPVASALGGGAHAAHGGGATASQVEQAVLGPVTPKPINTRARVTSVETPNPKMEWNTTDPFQRQVPPPRDPMLLPGQRGPSPVINESVPNPGFDPVRAADPLSPPAPMPARPTLDRPVTNPSYGERTEIVPPVRFSTSEPTIPTTVDAPPSDPGIGTRFSSRPGTTVPFSRVMEGARNTRDVAADRGATFGVSRLPGLKAEADALDQSAGILATHGHDAVAPVLGPEKAADYLKTRQNFQTVKRGLDAVNATRQTGAAPGNGIGTEFRGQIGATAGDALVPGGGGAIFGARLGRALARLKNVFPNSAFDKTRRAEALLGDARTHTGNASGAVLRGVRAAPYSATLGAAASAGESAGRSAEFDSDPNLSALENIKRAALQRWLAENADKEK